MSNIYFYQKTKINIILLTIILLLPNFVLAAPNINNVSGNVSDESQITITGSDFGASGPEVLLFDDFEGGENGHQLSLNLTSLGHWDGQQSNQLQIYSNANSISGALGARFDADINYPTVDVSAIWVDAPTTFDSFYMSYWAMIPLGDIYPCCTGGPTNWKQLWVTGTTNITQEADFTIASNGANSWSIMGNHYPITDGIENPGESSDVGESYNHYLKNPFDSNIDVVINTGEWVRHSIWIKGATNQTGEERIWITRLTTGTDLVKSRNRQTIKDGEANRRRRFYLNGYNRQTDTGNSHPTFDDVYIAYGENAQARVEVGNASAYSDCTSLAMCTSVSWSASSIICTFRQSNLQNGEAFLFVTDENGEVNGNGFPITIGSGSADTTAPNVPTNLSVL